MNDVGKFQDDFEKEFWADVFKKNVLEADKSMSLCAEIADSALKKLRVRVDGRETE